jgi:hypothetical protein
MGVRDQLRRAYYGSAIGSTAITGLPIPSLYSLATTPTGQATAYTDLQARSLKPYVLEKHAIGNRRITSFWYFGRCVDNDGRVIGGTERLSPYPFRVYCDNGSGYYGTLPLGAQGVQGRAVITSARFDFRKASATAGSNGVASSAQGLITSTTNAAGTGIAASAAGLKFSLAAGVIASNATQTAVEASSLGTGAASITDGALSNLISFTTTGTLSSGVQNFAGSTTLNTTITDSTGQTASTTFAALTGTVTSTVAGAALAQLAANENKRLGLFGAILAGTSAVQGLFLNIGSTTTADADNGTDNTIAGECLLNGVVEVSYELVGDI